MTVWNSRKREERETEGDWTLMMMMTVVAAVARPRTERIGGAS